MTALHDFIQAAASHYGVPVDQLNEGSTLDASSGDLEVVLRIALTPEDVASIAQRMQRMALDRKVGETLAGAVTHAREKMTPTREQLRAEYNGMTTAERSKFGSFARFVAMREGDDPFAGPDVAEKAELPPHVWLDRNECTDQQKAMAVGTDEKGRYAVDPADLTEQQRTRLAGTVLDVVTSNADDFGGLPG